MTTKLETINGYNILFISSELIQPLIGGMVRVSEAHEGSKHYGISNLLERVLMKSWSKHVNITEELNKRRLKANTETHPHYVWYNCEGRDTPFAVRYMSKILSSPDITNSAVNKGKNSIQRDFKEYRKSANMEMEYNIWKYFARKSGVTYNLNMSIFEKNINKLTKSGLIDFFNKNYNRDTITFIVFCRRPENKEIGKLFKRRLPKINTPLATPLIFGSESNFSLNPIHSNNCSHSVPTALLKPQFRN